MGSFFGLQMSGFERGRILTRAAHLLRENLDEIAVLEVKVTKYNI